jgi:DnaJ-domain-containing protein 1
VRSSRITGPPPVGPESTNARTRTEPNATSPIEPPSSRTPTEPDPGSPMRPQTTGAPPVRHSRDTQPPPMGGSQGRQRPHSTTHPPILRRSHSLTSTIPPESMRGAAAEIRKMIADKITSLERGADHYSILGVSQMSKGDEIRAAYFGIAKRIHPDRLRAVGVTDVGPDAQRLFARINQAFGVLSDPQRRAEYSVMLAAGGEDAVRKAQADAEEHAGRVLRAEETFRRGEMALRRSQFESARMLFEEAVELNGEEAEYHALLAWATWLAAPNKQLVAVDVQKRLAQALAMSPQCVPAHFYCGQVAKHSGQVQAALDSFRVVVDLEPDHVEANLELRVLRGRLRKR